MTAPSTYTHSLAQHLQDKLLLCLVFCALALAADHKL